jgi:TldD protein
VLIHELIGHALEADTVLSEGSLLARSKTGSAGRDLITVIDDPRRGRAPWKVDDEGADATPVALIREGRIGGLLHDSVSAQAMGKTPTGHGRCASYSSPVRPRMGCTFLAAGQPDAREIIETTRVGIHVRRIESAGTDPRSGHAYFRVTDSDRIEGGRIDAPLQPFLLRSTVVEALASIDRIADDLAFDTCIGSCVRDGQALATSVGAPTFRLGVATIIH